MDPLVLIILDGYGLRDETRGNAIKSGNTPVMDRVYSERPWSVIKASGEAVGLPEGQIGNSEVGHMNIGAGRIVYQPLTRINKSIETGEFYDNEELNDCINTVNKNNSTLHLIGLLSDGGVHSHQNHLTALLDLAKQQNLTDVAVHAFLDGRDVPPRSAKPFLEKLMSDFEEMGVGRLATMGGRYYGMDRDERWDRTKKAYKAIVKGEAEVYETDPIQALQRAYADRDEDDEFITPTVFTGEHEDPLAPVDEDDGIIFFNFRPDRARQLTRALTQPNFKNFDTDARVDNFVCMAEYDEDFDLPVAFPPLDLEMCLTEYLSKSNLKQFHTAETEKYAHVTFFFNGGVEDPFQGEERTLVPSPKISTYDKKPEMSAYEVTSVLVDRINASDDDFIVLNYANPDMVGHTGDFNATVTAIEAIDDCLGTVLDTVLDADGEILITSDHGNAEMMVDDESRDKHTAHTTNPCPLIYVGPRTVKLDDGILADIAPTILELLDLPVPEQMEGRSLITYSRKQAN